MKYEFVDTLVTHVPTCALIEAYQTLKAAIETDEKEDALVVLECLQEQIDRYTEVPAGLDIKPSGSSLIAMSCSNGVIMIDGSDVKCAGGIPVSEAGSHLCCTKACEKEKCCCPDKGELRLFNGFLYKMADTSMKDEELLDSLEKLEGTTDVFSESWGFGEANTPAEYKDAGSIALVTILKRISEQGFGISFYEEKGAPGGFDIEDWTPGGVDMIHLVDLRNVDGNRSNVYAICNELRSIADDFDVDKEIEVHRQDKRYRDAFSHRDSVKDFESWGKTLLSLADDITDAIASYEAAGHITEDVCAITGIPLKEAIDIACNG